MIKRLFDIAVASVALIMAAPLVVAAACGIKLSSPGPILFPTQGVVWGRCGVMNESVIASRFMNAGAAIL